MLKQELEKRNLLYQYTDENLFKEFEKGGKVFYLGIDPSADSLQLGNLVPIMAAINLIKYGNSLVLIVGGATGMIGDPSGKDKERQMKSIEEIKENAKKIHKQLLDIFQRIKKTYKDYTGQDISQFNNIRMINNYDFYKNMSVLDFLREIGKYITVNQMIAKESIKKRLENPDTGISYTEFSYMLLQGYDFVKLYDDLGVQLQIGGADQWGNIVTGVELIRKKLGKDDARGLTVPLLTTSDGKKFGKSEGNAIWLDPNKNSPYFVYQYFINTTDEDIEKFLKTLTILPLEKIEEVVSKHQQYPEERYGQKILAYELVKFLFCEEEAELSKKISEILFGKSEDIVGGTVKKIDILQNLNENQLQKVFAEIGGSKYDGEKKLLDYLVESGLASSKSQARRFIKDGAIYLNEIKITDEDFMVKSENLLNNKVALLRRGKKNYKLLII